MTRNKRICGWVTLGCLAILSIVLISCAFSYVEWNQLALKQNVVTNTVDYTGGVVGSGQYFWGLTSGPVVFDRTITTVSFTGDNAIVIFSDGGLELQIACAFQYAIIQDLLPTLYQNYGTTYPTQIQSIGLSILKNVAPNFTLSEYYENRTLIRDTMSEQLTAGLLSKMYVDVVYFQLNYVTFPNATITKLLTIAVQNQTNIETQWIQQAALIRQDTALLAQQILANASVINQTAIATASFLQQQAQATAFTIIQEARKTGYAQIYAALNLTTTELQLSYLYTTQLAQQGSTATLLVNLPNGVVVNGNL